MYQKPYLTALKIAISLRMTTKDRGRLTSKDFGTLAKNKDFTPGYFVQVKETAEELGIGIHALPNGGYLVLDTWAAGTGNILNIDEFCSEQETSIEELECHLKALSSSYKINPSLAGSKEPEANNLIEKLWFELITQAEQHTTISYGELSLSLGLRHHKGLEKPLRATQRICQQNNYPTLSDIVVVQTTQLPPGVPVSNHDKWCQALEMIYEFDWSQSLDVVDFEKYL